MNEIKKTIEDKAKKTNAEISLSKRYKFFIISKFSIIYCVSQPAEIDRSCNECKIHQLYKTTASIHYINRIMKLSVFIAYCMQSIIIG